MFPQEDFNRFVENYNRDYLYILTRASSGSYECLITSCRVLKDLYDIIMRIHEVGGVNLQLVPYPLTFRASDEFLRSLGYEDAAIENVRGFLAYVKESQGKELEDCIRDGFNLPCGAPIRTS